METPVLNAIMLGVFLGTGIVFFVSAGLYYALAVKGALDERRDKKKLYEELMKNAVIVQTEPPKRKMDA